MIFLGLLRVIVFFWIAATSFSIYQLYADGYRITKTESRIIRALVRILFWVSIVFFYLAFTAFVYTFHLDCHHLVVSLMPIAMLPLGFLLTWFRKESITRDK